MTDLQQHTPVARKAPPRPVSLARLFADVATCPTDADKINMLRLNYDRNLIQLLRYILDPEIQWNVSPMRVPPSTVADQEGWLRIECRRLYLFVTDPQRPSPIAEELEKRQLLWRSLLESLLADEQALLLRACRKELPDGIEPAIVLWQEGRHPHCHFRSLLRLHSRYGPSDCSAA